MQHVLQMDSAGDGADIVGTLTADADAATVVYICVCVCVRACVCVSKHFICHPFFYWMCLRNSIFYVYLSYPANIIAMWLSDFFSGGP